MAKTLKDFLNERQLGPMVVKNPDEQKFIDKHVVAKTADRNGNGDDVFKGDKVKMADRKKEGHGYNPGEDEEVYEELKGNQHKIDANKNGKVDAHDFKLLRGKKKMKEEVEELEELSTPTLQSYRKKARAQGNAIVDKMKMGAGDWSKDQKDTKTLRKRAAGAQMSGKRLVKRGESLKTEEAEQIDELSKKTLGSYVKKASDTLGHSGIKAQSAFEKGDADGSFNTLKKMVNRNKGIGRAVDKLTKEEVEQIDELSNKTLGSYVKKAKDQMSRSDTLAGRAMGAREHGAKPSAAERKHNARANKRYFGIDKAVDKMTKEEVELEEAMSSYDRYTSTHGDVMKMMKSIGDHLAAHKKAAISHKNSYDEKKKGPHWGHVGDIDRIHSQVKDIHDQLAQSGEYRMHEEVELEEKISPKASMGTYIKDFQKSDAPQFKGKSKEKRRVMAIAAKLSAERGGKPLKKEERLLVNLGDLSETHKRTMLSVFEKLNEDNQRKFMAACETPEGIEQMLDFAINNRGE
jgi:hypothetical protein